MSKKFWITSICVASLFFILFATIMAIVLANGNAALPIDSSIADWAYGVRGEKGNFTYWFFTIITELGHYYFVIAFLLIMAIVWKFKGKTWFLVLPVFATFVLHELIKLIVKRPRPDQSLWWGYESSTSFPSGHSNTATCLFILVIFFVIISPYLKPWLKAVLSSLCSISIVLVAVSRIILGMHYFTDVIAGIFLGATSATIGIIIYLVLKNKKKNKEKERKDENNLCSPREQKKNSRQQTLRQVKLNREKRCKSVCKTFNKNSNKKFH